MPTIWREISYEFLFSKFELNSMFKFDTSDFVQQLVCYFYIATALGYTPEPTKPESTHTGEIHSYLNQHTDTNETLATHDNSNTTGKPITYDP